MIHKPCARAFYSDMVRWLDEVAENWRQNGPDGKECADLAEEESKRAEYLSSRRGARYASILHDEFMESKA